jgi:glycerophosphoryl diester phosphodiesterase
MSCVFALVRCIEFDISFTSDGHAVVFHDDTIDRLVTSKYVGQRIDQERRNSDEKSRDKKVQFQCCQIFIMPV